MVQQAVNENTNSWLQGLSFAIVPQALPIRNVPKLYPRKNFSWFQSSFVSIERNFWHRVRFFQRIFFQLDQNRILMKRVWKEGAKEVWVEARRAVSRNGGGHVIKKKENIFLLNSKSGHLFPGLPHRWRSWDSFFLPTWVIAWIRTHDGKAVFLVFLEILARAHRFLHLSSPV